MPAFLRALRSRNYRLYFIGQLISLAGTWMQQIAMSWLAYRLSSSAFVLGLVALASQLPLLVLAPLGGLLADRFPCRRLLLWTQSLSLLQALLLGALTLAAVVTPPWLVGLALLLGCINAIDVPARQTLAVQLVDQRDDLPNAIALNAFLMNSARFVGPALAGLVVAQSGEATCFFLNAASYLAVLLALLALRLPATPAAAGVAPLTALRQGFAYAFAHRDIRASLLLVASMSLLLAPYVVLMPLFAREVFHGDARTFGMLVGSAGLGALLASINLARRSSTAGLARLTGILAPGAGLALLAFAHSDRLLFAFPALLALGFCLISTIAGSNTLVQTAVSNDYRGRVMSIFTMAFLGLAPLGSFAVGSLAHGLGVRFTLSICALLGMAAGLTYRASVLRQEKQAEAGHD